MKLAASALGLVVALSPAAARADDEAWRAWYPRLDGETAAWFLGGYSIHVGVQPPAAPRLVLSVGAYAFDVPDLLLELTGNDPAALQVRLFLGYGVFVDHDLGAAPDHGWRLGAQLGAQHHETATATATRRYVNGLVLVRGGYAWHPGGFGGYVFPWLGAAVTPRLHGDASDHDTWPVTPYVAVDVGWRM